MAVFSWVPAPGPVNRATPLERAQERDQVGFLLRCEDKAKARLVKTHGVQQCLSRSIVEKRGAGGETAQDRPFDLADVVEFAVYQGLAEVGRGLAVAPTRHSAHRDLWQVAHVEPT